MPAPKPGNLPAEASPNAPAQRRGIPPVLISHDRLRAAAVRIFRASGSEAEEAAIVADHLVEANLRGHDSHGVGMIPTYMESLAAGTLKPNHRGRVAQQDGSFIVYDGERGYGQVVARAATDLAIQHAQKSGIAVLALRNAHHIGRVGSYGEQCAAAGLVSIHFVNVIGNLPRVAPHRGTDARLSTNPICIAFPAAEVGRPMILDLATSKVALGKVRVALNEGHDVAPGLIMDSRGQPTTDPAAMFEPPVGALLPLAEHKGYGLAFACELLAGAIGGSGTFKKANQDQRTVTNGMLAFILDPQRLVERDWLMSEIEEITGYVTASPPHDPGEPVIIPGDPERQKRKLRMAEGIPLDGVTYGQLVDCALAHGLNADVLTG
jgi:hydroxycarboxylate dehydrogenase B